MPAGEVAVIWVALLTVKEAAELLPNLTAVAPEKLVPVMVTLVPPCIRPVFGLTLATWTAPHPWPTLLGFFQPVPVSVGRMPLTDRSARSGLCCRSRCEV